MNILIKSIALFSFIGVTQIATSQNIENNLTLNKNETSLTPISSVESQKNNAIQMEKEEKELQEQMKIAVTRRAKQVPVIEPKKD